MSEEAEIASIVPKAKFIEDVTAFAAGRPAEEVLQELQDALQRYQFVEQELVKRKRRLLIKEPEIRRCLDGVELLLQQRENATQQTKIDFSLADQVYARAILSDVDSVGIWLGAGVMVEYLLEEAKELLEKQLKACKSQLDAAQKDHEYVKDQLTTSEVSLARVYNWDVENRKAAQKKNPSP